MQRVCAVVDNEQHESSGMDNELFAETMAIAAGGQVVLAKG